MKDTPGAHHILLFLFLFVSFHRCHLLSAYYVAFGPYGPRAPVTPPGQSLKVFLSTLGLVGVAGLMYLGVRAMGKSILYVVLSAPSLTIVCVIAPPPPRTITKEWEEASNERAKDQKMNPITGTFNLSFLIIVLPAPFPS